jgi:hypothetical protein
MDTDFVTNLLGDADTWTDDLRGQATWRISMSLKDKAQIARLLTVAGHPELVDQMPEHTGVGTISEHGFIIGKLIDIGASPQALLAAYTQVVDETVAANDAIRNWLKQHGGSIDLRRELGLIGRLIDPGFDPDGPPDGDDYKDTRWYPALLRLITRVRDEAKAGNTVLTPDELDEQLAEFKRRHVDAPSLAPESSVMKSM